MALLEHVYFEGIAPHRAASVVTRARQTSREPLPRRDLSEPGKMDDFVVRVFSQAGLDAQCYHRRSLSRRLPACLRRLRAATVDEAHRLVSDRPELLDEALNVLLLGVTQFFRDSPVFDCLRDFVLPGLTSGERPLRIWSAACSDGQELYSVALLLHARGWLGRSELLGTDLRASAIARARAGVYPNARLDELEPDHRRHLGQAASEISLPAPIRDAMRWQRQDLFQVAAPGPWDVILWRNMAIYLTPPSADDIWRRIWSELRPGGYCVTGKAEQPPRDLAWTRVGPCVFRKREDAPA